MAHALFIKELRKERSFVGHHSIVVGGVLSRFDGSQVHNERQ